MEERPLLTPDEVRRLNPDQAILIPERQNPLLVRIGSCISRIRSS
jgi:type IV secretion system protein VirD4